MFDLNDMFKINRGNLCIGQFCKILLMYLFLRKVKELIRFYYF